MSLPGSDFGSIARDGLRLPTPYEAPIGKSETAIAEIFAEIFSVGRVGANDDFFDLGGDSLLAESSASSLRNAAAATSSFRR